MWFSFLQTFQIGIKQYTLSPEFSYNKYSVKYVGLSGIFQRLKIDKIQAVKYGRT